MHHVYIDPSAARGQGPPWTTTGSQLTEGHCLTSNIAAACPSASIRQGCDSDSVVGGSRQSWYSAPDALVGLGRGLWTRWRWAAACTTGESTHSLSAGVTETGVVMSCPTQGYLKLKISILNETTSSYPHVDTSSLS